MGEAVLPATPAASAMPEAPGPPLDLSPSAASISAHTSPPTDLEVALARPWQLLLARSVDAILILCLMVLVALLDVWVLGPGWRPQGTGLLTVLIEWFDSNAQATKVAAVLGGLFGFGYVLWSSVRFGTTAGGWLSGILIVRTNNRPIPYALAIFRTCIALVSLVSGGAGFFWAMLDRHRRSWHDLAAGTVLIRRRLPNHSLPQRKDAPSRGRKL